MYQHILIPTDGTQLSARAVNHGVELAKRVHARVVGLSIIAPWKEIAQSIAVRDLSQQQYEKAAAAFASSSLLGVSDAAQRLGVICSVVQLKHPRPWRAIVDTAQAMRCDLILMASHLCGDRGSLVVGSETRKVLTHSSIPVLVFRDDELAVTG